jgi:hypothetical protein
MRFADILPALNSGKKIRAKTWDEGAYIKLVNNKIWLFNLDRSTQYIGSLDIPDWEEVKPLMYSDLMAGEKFNISYQDRGYLYFTKVDLSNLTQQYKNTSFYVSNKYTLHYNTLDFEVTRYHN